MFENITSSIMMRRSRSTDSNSSCSSLSLSPSGWVPSPSRTTLSPPSITSSSTLFTEQITSSTMTRTKSCPGLLLEPTPFTFSSSHRTYRSMWPARESLTPPPTSSPTTSYFSSMTSVPDSRISDDDLLALDFSTPKMARSQSQPDEAVVGISWSAINNPSSAIVPVVQVSDRRRRLPPPPPQYRRRSTSRRSPERKRQKTLGAIAE